MRQLVLVVLAQAQVLFADAVFRIPSKAFIEPSLMPFLIGARHNEKLDFHLLKLTAAKSEISRRDLVTERLADLRDTEGQLHAHGLKNIIEVDENTLSGFRSQISHGGIFLHRTHKSLEHQVKLARFGELAFAASGAQRASGAAVLTGLAGRHDKLIAFGCLTIVNPFHLIDLICTKSLFARAAIDHRIGEMVEMAAGLPNSRVHQDR